MAIVTDPAEMLSMAWHDVERAQQSADIDVVRDCTSSAIRMLIRAMVAQHGLKLTAQPGSTLPTEVNSVVGESFDMGKGNS